MASGELVQVWQREGNLSFTKCFFFSIAVLDMAQAMNCSTKKKKLLGNCLSEKGDITGLTFHGMGIRTVQFLI